MGAISQSVVRQMMHVRDEKAVGTAGGASLAGVNIRALNTVVRNTIPGASLAANQVTLPAGKYRISGQAAVGNKAGANKLYLYDVTNAVLAIAGSSSDCSTATVMQVPALLNGPLIIVASTVYELRHQIAAAVAATGLGVATNVAAAGVEVFAELWIEKE